MAIERKKIIRLSFDTVAQARAADAMVPGQWAFCKVDKVLIVRDLAGEFTEYPAPSGFALKVQTRDTAGGTLEAAVGFLGDVVLPGQGLERDFDSNGVLRFEISDAILKSFNDTSAGLLSGGRVTTKNPTTATIEAFEVIFPDHSTTDPVFNYYARPDVDVPPIGLGIAGQEFTLVWIDSTGIMRQDYGTAGVPNLATNVVFGSIGHQNGSSTITGTTSFAQIARDFPRQLREYILDLGIARVGAEVSGVSGTRNLQRAAGRLSAPGISNTGGLGNWTDSDSRFAILSGSLTWAYTTPAGLLPGQTLIDGAQFWNGSALASVPTNNWTIQTVYYSPNGSTYITRGTATFASISEARAAALSTIPSLPAGLSSAPLNRAAILLVKQGITSTTDGSQFEIIRTGKTGDSVGGGSGSLGTVYANLLSTLSDAQVADPNTYPTGVSFYQNASSTQGGFFPGSFGQTVAFKHSARLTVFWFPKNTAEVQVRAYNFDGSPGWTAWRVMADTSQIRNSLASLTDVADTVSDAGGAGSVLTWNGTEWVRQTPAAGSTSFENWTIGRYIETSPGNTYYVGLAEGSDGSGDVWGPWGSFGTFNNIDLVVTYASSNQNSATVTLEYSTDGTNWTAIGASFTVTRYNNGGGLANRFGVRRTYTGSGIVSTARIWRLKVSVSNTSTRDAVSGQIRFY